MKSLSINKQLIEKEQLDFFGVGFSPERLMEKINSIFICLSKSKKYLLPEDHSFIKDFLSTSFCNLVCDFKEKHGDGNKKNQIEYLIDKLVEKFTLSNEGQLFFSKNEVKKLIEDVNLYVKMYYSYREQKEFINESILLHRDVIDRGFSKKITDSPGAYQSGLWELIFLGLITNKHSNRVGFEGFNNHGPDFRVKINEFSFLVECVVPRQSSIEEDQIIPIPPYNMCEIDWQRELGLRISNSIANKKEQYKNWIKDEIIFENEIFVIAIGLYDLSFPSYMEINGLIDDTSSKCPASLFSPFCPIGKEVLNVKTSMSGFLKEEVNFKGNGSEVRKNIFCNAEHDFISAVLFSYGDIDVSGRYTSPNNLVVLHNPFARNPLKHELITKEPVRVIKEPVRDEEWYFECRSY